MLQEEGCKIWSGVEGWKAERRVGGKEGNDTPEIASLSKERRKSGREVRAEEVKYAWKYKSVNLMPKKKKVQV